MAEATPLMRLAAIFAEWQSDQHLFGAERYERYRDKYQQFGELIALFREADPLERTEVRHLLRQPGRRPLWDFVEAWWPAEGDYPATWDSYKSASHSFLETNYREYLRLILAAKALSYGMIDYRDDILSLQAIAKSVEDRGLNWQPFAEELGRLNADYLPTAQNEAYALTEQQATALNAEIEAQTRLIEENPQALDAYLKRAAAYTDLGELDKALKDVQQACRLDYKSADAHFQRGTVYALMGNINAAFNDYVDVVSRFPTYPQADMIRARINEWRDLRR